MVELHNLPRYELLKRTHWYEKRYGPYIEKKGIKNWKNLFRKPTFSEWIILAMLIGLGFVAWAYQRDIAACHEVINQTQFVWNFGK